MITSLFESRSVEDPTVPLTYDNALPLVGESTSAGINVNAETALTYSAVWRAVSLISRDVAKIPLVVYRREGQGKQRDTRHPAYRVLKSRPNEYQTAFTWRALVTSWALLRGNGYAFISRDPLILIPLHPDQVRPLTDSFSPMNGDDVEYEYTRADGVILRLRSSDLIHIKNLTDNGVEGVSVISKARESFGLGIAAERHGGRFFANNARPSLVLEHPAHLGEDAINNLRRTWSANHAGEAGAWKPAILEEGMTARTVSVTNEDAQYLQSRQFQVREIANWFGVPPHLLGDDARVSYNSLEQENQSYIDKALDPWFVSWEEELTAKILTEEEQMDDSHTVEFVRQALLRADLSTRGEYYSKAVGGPWLTRDEARGLENLNPLEGGSGAGILAPLNMSGSVTDPEEPEPEPEPEPDPEPAGRSDDNIPQPADPVSHEPRDWTAHAHLLEVTISRMARRVAEQAKRASGSADRLRDFVADRLAGGQNRSSVRDSVSPVIEALAAFGGIDACAASIRGICDSIAADIFEAARACLEDIDGDGDGDGREALVRDRVRGYVAESPPEIAARYCEMMEAFDG